MTNYVGRKLKRRFTSKAYYEALGSSWSGIYTVKDQWEQRGEITLRVEGESGDIRVVREKDIGKQVNHFSVGQHESWELSDANFGLFLFVCFAAIALAAALYSIAA